MSEDNEKDRIIKILHGPKIDTMEDLFKPHVLTEEDTRKLKKFLEEYRPEETTEKLM